MPAPDVPKAPSELIEIHRVSRPPSGKLTRFFPVRRTLSPPVAPWSGDSGSRRPKPIRPHTRYTPRKAASAKARLRRLSPRPSRRDGRMRLRNSSPHLMTLSVFTRLRPARCPLEGAAPNSLPGNVPVWRSGEHRVAGESTNYFGPAQIALRAPRGAGVRGRLHELPSDNRRFRLPRDAQ